MDDLVPSTLKTVGDETLYTGKDAILWFFIIVRIMIWIIHANLSVPIDWFVALNLSYKKRSEMKGKDLLYNSTKSGSMSHTYASLKELTSSDILKLMACKNLAN